MKRRREFGYTIKTRIFYKRFDNMCCYVFGMREYILLFAAFAAVVAMDWIVFGGRYEMLFLQTAEEMVSVAANGVENFLSRNLRRG